LALILGPGFIPGTVQSAHAQSQGQALRLGVGQSAEEKILGHLTALVLKSKKLAVDMSPDLDPQVLRQRLIGDEIDLCWEYTGRALIVFQRNPDRGILVRPLDCYQEVKRADQAQGLTWGTMAPANNTYGLLMAAERADKLKIKTISDLAAQAKASEKKLKLGLETAFRNRPDGYPALAVLYGFEAEAISLVDLRDYEIFRALQEGRIDAAVGPVIDGRIILFELRPLIEDRPFFPAYNPAPLWRQDAAQEHPQAFSLINHLASALDTAALTRIRYLVEVNHRSPAQAAQEWFETSGLASD